MANRLLPKPDAAPTVLHLVADRTGCTLWRVFQPCKYLQEQGYRVWWGDNNNEQIGTFGQMADVLVLPRLSWPEHAQAEARKWFALCRSAGKRIVYEADDDLFTPEFLVRTIDADWLDGKTFDQLERDRLARIWAMQLCDAVTVTTERLADVVRQFTAAPVYVIPNALDLPWFEGVVRGAERQVQGLSIGWAGGRRAEHDVRELALAWGRLARRFPELRFVVAGWMPKAFQGTIPADRLFHIPWLPLEQYPLGLANVDIGCATVNDSPFNRCKSLIKVWEYTAAGAPVVASHALYGEWVRDGRDGLLATTVEEWERQLARLVEDRWLRERLQRRAMARVRAEHTLAGNAHRWLAAWAEIARRPSVLVA